MKKTSEWLSGLWFGSVGAVAALVHMAVFEVLRHFFSPECANLGGFVIAFAVSYAGHRRLSFKDATTSTSQSLFRFAATSLSGFATNALSFMALVYVFQWAVWPALIVAMLLAAAQTFVLSRWWAFRR